MDAGHCGLSAVGRRSANASGIIFESIHLEGRGSVTWYAPHEPSTIWALVETPRVLVDDSSAIVPLFDSRVIVTGKFVSGNLIFPNVRVGDLLISGVANRYPSRVWNGREVVDVAARTGKFGHLLMK